MGLKRTRSDRDQEDEGEDEDDINLIGKRTRSGTSSLTTTPQAKRIKTSKTPISRAKKRQSQPIEVDTNGISSPSKEKTFILMDNGVNEEITPPEKPTSPKSPLKRGATPSKEMSPSKRERWNLLALKEAKKDSVNTRSGALSPKRRSPTKKDTEKITLEPKVSKSIAQSPQTSRNNKEAYEEDDNDEYEGGYDDDENITSTVARNLFQTPGKAKEDKINEWNKSARKKATRHYLDDEDDQDGDIVEDILSGESPRKNIFQILDEQGSKSLFLDGFEGYFDQHKSREKISTTRFDDVPELTYADIRSKVQAEAKSWERQRAVMKHDYREMFDQWAYELNNGFSLLFYGVGSKHDLMNEFASTTLEHHQVLVVNGFNPDTNIREVLSEVASATLPKNVVNALPKLPNETITAIAKRYEEKPLKNDLTIVIHNIDGEALRSDKDQVVLTRLAAASPHIHIIASVDHLYAPMLWDVGKTASSFKWVFHQMHTYEKYTIETEFDSQLTMGKESTLGNTKGAQYVLASLPENSKKLYNLLLFHQMETLIEEDPQAQASAAHGMEFQLLYKKCVEEFIVSNELNFRTMLTEFIEHAMIKSTKDASGNETLYIPLKKEAVEHMVEEIS